MKKNEMCLARVLTCHSNKHDPSSKRTGYDNFSSSDSSSNQNFQLYL